MIDLDLDLSSTQLTVPDPIEARPRELLTLIDGTTDEYLLVVDNTALEKVMMCPTMAAHYLWWRREGHARNAALTFGGAVHEGLECLLRGPQDGIELTIDFLLRIRNRITTFWNSNPSPPDEYRTLSNAIEVVERYIERSALPDYEWRILSDSAGLLIERPFEVPLGVIEVNALIKLPEWFDQCYVRYIHVAWSGRIDVGAKLQERNRIVDHKTTSIAGDNFVQDFQLSNQTMGYVWAAQQLWPEHEISGFCLNAIHLKKPAMGKGISEPGPRGGPPALNFFRAYYDYTPERLEEWSTNALTIIEDFVHCMVRGYFPMYTKQCFNKYGKCSYHDVCTMDNPQARTNFLLSDAFKTVTWNPTNGR